MAQVEFAHPHGVAVRKFFHWQIARFDLDHGNVCFLVRDPVSFPGNCRPSLSFTVIFSAPLTT